MKDLEKMLGKKKKDGEADPMKKEAKLGVLKDLRGMASGMMKDGMKATVMAKDKSGLEKGLEKAKDMVAHAPGEENPALEQLEEETGRDLDSDMEQGEDPKHKAMVMAEDCSPEELDEMIKALEDKKREKMMKG